MGILPLGTGNDLSRVLGSGEACVEASPETVLARLRRATVVSIDRWLVRGGVVRGGGCHYDQPVPRATHAATLGWFINTFFYFCKVFAVFPMLFPC